LAPNQERINLSWNPIPNCFFSKESGENSIQMSYLEELSAKYASSRQIYEDDFDLDCPPDGFILNQIFPFREISISSFFTLPTDALGKVKLDTLLIGNALGADFLSLAIPYLNHVEELGSFQVAKNGVYSSLCL
jgi:hypothetical protein